MLLNYTQLVEKIAKASNLSVEEVDRKVEAKCAKLSGLISKEGSAQIVASELGISFDREKMKINELVDGMKKINLAGKVIDAPTIRAFNKNGRDGKVLSMTVADETDNIRVVLWDTNHISLFEDNHINLNDSIEISNASIRNNELHLGSFSDIKKSKETFDFVQTSKKIQSKNISELQAGQNAQIRAIVVQVFEPRFFEDKKTGVKKPLLALVLDDGTESIRGATFAESIGKFGVSQDELENIELFTRKKQEILGMEAIFSVNVRNNVNFNTKEVTINDVQTLDLDKLIEVLKN